MAYVMKSTNSALGVFDALKLLTSPMKMRLTSGLVGRLSKPDWVARFSPRPPMPTTLPTVDFEAEG